MLGFSIKVVAFACFFAALIAAVGDSTPKTEAAEPLQIVALGDSLTWFGGFSERYREYIQRDLGISGEVANLGTYASSSGEILDRLRANPDYRTAVANADIITLQAGINDLNGSRLRYRSGECGGLDNLACMETMVATFNANWSALLEEILAIADPATTAIRPFDIHYPNLATDQANGSFPVLDPYLQQMNQHIAAESVRLGVPLATVHTAFNGASGDADPVAAGYVLPDGVHTTDAGNRVIADSLRSAGYLPLTVTCRDVNADNRVNVVDLFLIAQNIGRPVAGATTAFDVNADRSISVTDLFLTARHVGITCT